MYSNFTDKFDWYLKADDDTFIILENLKHMLRQLNPGQPVYLGGRSMTLLKNGYNGGGAGEWIQALILQKNVFLPISNFKTLQDNS